MELNDLIRILRKHLVLLLITPIFMAGLVIFLTRNPSYKYQSEMTLYTGIASGSSVEMDKSFNYFASNIAFDNLLTVMKLRKTQEEVGLRLLTQHLMLTEYDPQYISKKSFEELQKITPEYVKNVITKPTSSTIGSSPTNVGTTKKSATSPVVSQQTVNITHTVKSDETLFSISKQYGITAERLKELNNLANNKIKIGKKLIVGQNSVSATGTGENASQDSIASFSFADIDNNGEVVKSFLPSSINRQDYEEKVRLITEMYNSNDTNFVHKILSFVHPHYSVDAISSINVQRISNSDLIKLTYQSDDPGICRNTLLLINEVFIRTYKRFKENRSDAVVKYFEFQLNEAAQKLKSGESKLLEFNRDNNIINYYEQSKAVAGVKEDLDVEYYNKRGKLAGLYAAIKRLEEKLDNQQVVQLKSTRIIELRNKLSDLNFRITTMETTSNPATTDAQQLADLKLQSEKLKEEIKQVVGELYTQTNSINGLPVNTILTEWLNNVIEAESTKAGLEVLGERIKEFQKQYAIYAPAGANLKRIEREISVSEQEFLEILHGLNLAKLKMQDNELSANIKTVDQPYFPLNPIPTKRKILVLAAAMFGFLIVLSTVFALEFFDNTLKNPAKASKILNLPFLAIFPKILLKTRYFNFSFVTNRMLEIAVQNIQLQLENQKSADKTKTLLFFSTLNDEGKSVVAGNLALKLKSQGEKILYIDFSHEALKRAESENMGYEEHPEGSTHLSVARGPEKFSLLNWLLGYPDDRIDFNSPFLRRPQSYLAEEECFSYQIDERFYAAKSYLDILGESKFTLSQIPDYVLIVLPAILYYPFPVGLITNADLSTLICRANRSWTTADQGVLDLIAKISNQKTFFILNGVELPVVESVMGYLPKKRNSVLGLAKIN